MKEKTLEELLKDFFERYALHPTTITFRVKQPTERALEKFARYKRYHRRYQRIRNASH
jgi:hypothetical protein